MGESDPGVTRAYTGDLVADLARFNDIVRTPGLCGWDTETTIAKAHRREVCLLQVTHEDGREAVVYVYPNGADRMRRAFDGCQATLIAHNAIFEQECMTKAGVFLPVECTYIAARVLFGTMEGDKRKRTQWSLAALSERFLNKSRDKTIRDRDWRIPPDWEAVKYGLDDTRDALALWKLFAPRFADDPGSWTGYRTVQRSLPATAESNLHGLPFDPEAHKALCADLLTSQQEHELGLDLLCEGQVDNPGSTKQLAQWFLDELLGDDTSRRDPGIFSMVYQSCTGQHWPLTDGGSLSFDKGSVESRLETLSIVAPNVAAYLLARLQWSKVTKLLQAFGPALQDHVDPDDGYIRGSFKPHGAQTSRESCSSPNLQQQPAEKRFRRLYKSKPGRKLVICDYGQIELRVGCLIAGDTAMQTIFSLGVDIHSATYENVQRAMGNPLTYDPDNPVHVSGRKAGKAVTFGALYGAMSNTIAISSGLPLTEAQVLLDTWLQAYPGIDTYRKTAFETAKAAGGVRLVSGQLLRMAADTRPPMTINAPVQGSAASVMYLAKTLTHERIVALRELGCDVWLAASIHDEIILDAADEDAEAAREILQEAMVEALLHFYPEAVHLGMATLADAAVVSSWAEKP